MYVNMQANTLVKYTNTDICRHTHTATYIHTYTYAHAKSVINTEIFKDFM